MATSIPEPYHQHVHEAWQQLAGGKRPTADSVLQVVRGSKATAVSAMQFFWVNYLPDMLAGRTATEVPDPITRLAAGMWDRAEKLATARAEKALQEEHDALADAQKAVAKERDGIAAERLRNKARLADAQAEAERRLSRERAEHQAAMDGERKRRETALAARSEAMNQLHAKHEQLQDSLREAERDTAVAAKMLATTEVELKATQQAATSSAALAQTRLDELELARESAERLAAAHQQDIDSLAEEHTRELAQVRGDHQDALDRLNQQFETTMSALRLAHDERVTELKQIIKKLEAAASRKRPHNKPRDGVATKE